MVAASATPSTTLPLSPLLLRSTVQLAAMIRSGEVSPLQVVDAHIARIEQVNPHIHAVVQPRFDAARAEARAAGERLAANPRTRGELSPFLGVPFTSKEHYAIEGMPQTAGLVRRRNHIARETATVVQRTRDAGFVLLGTTNVPEGLLWYESYNRVYGRTTNAYSIHHTPGGSSGGEGAIIGAGGSPVGLGGDVGGSIRNPAFFNGVCGHKPSGGRVPQTGSWPGAKGRHARYRVGGPLGRRVADLKALMPILVGPDGVDASVDGPAWGPPPAIDPSDITVYWFDSTGLARPSDDIAAATARAARELEGRGFRVERWTPPGIERAAEMWFGAMKDAGGSSFTGNLRGDQPLRLGRQLLKWPLRRSDHIGPVLATVLLETVLGSVRRKGSSEPLRLELQRTLEEQLGPRSVLMFPTFHTTAPKHGLDCLRHTLGFVNAAVLNPLEMPATAVPTGFGRDGLPTGVQIAGIRNNDALTLHVAEHLEDTLGGWQPGPIQGVD